MMKYPEPYGKAHRVPALLTVLTKYLYDKWISKGIEEIHSTILG